jgi:hypothetical protein
MTHTPTPWNTNSPDETLILGPDRQVVATTLQDEEDYQANHDTRYADAEFIVKCVNAHDDLVKVLSHLIHWHDQLSAKDIAMAKEALAKAGAA